MKDPAIIKSMLYDACLAFVQKRESSILSTIKSHQSALQTETKSSAGDKHETGRAMLQLEMEKAGKQLEDVYQMKQVLGKINMSLTEKKARLGSLILTTIGPYYLSISAGALKIEDKTYYAVSVDSPIGKCLLGSVPTDRLYFRNEFEVIDVV